MEGEGTIGNAVLAVEALQQVFANARAAHHPGYHLGHLWIYLIIRKDSRVYCFKPAKPVFGQRVSKHLRAPPPTPTDTREDAHVS